MAEVVQIELQDGRFAQISIGTGAGHISDTPEQFDPLFEESAHAITWKQLSALYPDPMGLDCPLGPCYRCSALVRGKCDWA